MAHVWCELILALIASSVGLAIVVVEGLVIADESEGIPGAFVLLHRIVAVKGVVQFLGGVLLTVRVCRGGIKLTIANLVIASMNAFSLSMQVIMDGYGSYDLHRQCLKYPEACVSGAPLQYAVTLVQSQEANFIIGTAINFIYVIILSSYMSAVTSNLSTARHNTTSHEDVEERGEDKVLYSQVAN